MGTPHTPAGGLAALLHLPRWGVNGWVVGWFPVRGLAVDTSHVLVLEFLPNKVTYFLYYILHTVKQARQER
ncbi:hypothetical protein KDAU_19980 [Dictyobacter aurantiacus]|uniref:Uncharacterized protein n=1 Tax=Dictyobacter aurantiacus TaxID=1936993 RepID=A0A401ZCU3_9CHLR|nr:hypothetical protein KDAU_19980 [Dictyobacter aurantiacus]